MTRDPLNLFPSVADRSADRSAQAQSQRTEVRSTGLAEGVGSLLLGILIGIAAVFAWQRFTDRIPDDGRDREHQEQRDDQLLTATKQIIFVEETGDRVRYPHLPTLLGNEDYWQQLEAKGIRMRPYEVDSPDAAPYRDAARAVGLPAVLFIDAGGKIIAAKSAPPTVAGVTELLEGPLR